MSLTILVAVSLCVTIIAAFLAARAIRASRRAIEAREASERYASALAEQTKQLDAALNNMSQGLCMFNAAGEIVVRNETYLRMYALSPEVVKPGCTLRRLIEHRREVGLFNGDVDHYVATILANVASGEIRTHIGTTADGRAINIVDRPMAGGGWVVTHEDISDRRRAEEKIAYMARHDALTDLANRAQFVERIEYEVARSRRSSEGFAIFVIDVDHFKAVNDSLGHPIGDQLLRCVADRLRNATRSGDSVARLGGDEFAILQTLEGRPIDSVRALAKRLLHSVGAPYEIEGHQVSTSVSIGIALAPQDGEEPSRLLKNADLALYRAKADGRNDCRFFEASMDAEARSRHELEADLRLALARDQFEIFYQTVFEVESGEITGAEALLRWRHPNRGLVRPDQFIPLAEETGLIVSIGEWVLKNACAQAAQWPRSLKLAVNLSAVQFKRGDLAATVAAALAQSGLAPERLELEITESVLLVQNADTLTALHGLKALGVAIVLDDFGTGFSSLSYLRMFPFDTIKIDRSFVCDMLTRSDCAAIVGAVTSLSRTLGITTTAEGVETPEQLALLRAAGCTLAQGFMLSKPRPAAELDFAPATTQLRATG
jgi:diguanylate cyclase (GGDEF)-like protein